MPGGAAQVWILQESADAAPGVVVEVPVEAPLSVAPEARQAPGIVAVALFSLGSISLCCAVASAANVRQAGATASARRRGDRMGDLGPDLGPGRRSGPPPEGPSLGGGSGDTSARLLQGLCSGRGHVGSCPRCAP